MLKYHLNKPKEGYKMIEKNKKQNQSLVLISGNIKINLGNWNLKEIDKITMQFNNEHELLNHIINNVLRFTSYQNSIDKISNIKKEKYMEFQLEHQYNKETLSSPVIYKSHQDFENIVDYVYSQYKNDKRFIERVIFNDYSLTIIKSKQQQKFADKVERLLKKVNSVVTNREVMDGIDFLYMVIHQSKQKNNYNAYRNSMNQVIRFIGGEEKIDELRSSAKYQNYKKTIEANKKEQPKTIQEELSFTFEPSATNNKVKIKTKEENTPIYKPFK